MSENRETRMPLADGRPLVIGNPTILQTYSLELIGPRDRHSPPFGLFTDAVQETEENLTDLLPEGYSARIREWDA